MLCCCHASGHALRCLYSILVQCSFPWHVILLSVVIAGIQCSVIMLQACSVLCCAAFCYPCACSRFYFFFFLFSFWWWCHWFMLGCWLVLQSCFYFHCKAKDIRTLLWHSNCYSIFVCCNVLCVCVVDRKKDMNSGLCETNILNKNINTA